ncbi:MAG: hypothetical protein FWC27_11290 [Firmicutes bacterium]|nr:hypothetical protein [Bacillota bacterium]
MAAGDYQTVSGKNTPVWNMQQSTGNSKQVATLAPGTIVSIASCQKNSSGNWWATLSVKVNGNNAYIYTDNLAAFVAPKQTTIASNQQSFEVNNTGVYVWSQPSSYSKAVRSVAVNTKVTATAYTQNAAGNTWYKIYDGWIHSGSLRPVSPSATVTTVQAAGASLAAGDYQTVSGKNTPVWSLPQSTGNSKQVATLAPGTIVTITSCQKNSSGNWWATLSVKVNGNDAYIYTDNLAAFVAPKQTAIQQSFEVNNTGIYVWSQPSSYSKAVRSIAVNTKVTATAYTQNAAGNTWYKIYDGWIYSGSLRQAAVATTSVVSTTTTTKAPTTTTKVTTPLTPQADVIKLLVGQAIRLSEFGTYKSSSDCIYVVPNTTVIYARKVGISTVTVSNGKVYSVEVLKNGENTETSIAYTPALYPVMFRGDSVNSSASLLPKSSGAPSSFPGMMVNQPITFTYKSDNPNVISVDSKGKLTAFGTGTANITVSSVFCLKPLTVTVKVIVRNSAVLLDQNTLSTTSCNKTMAEFCIAASREAYKSNPCTLDFSSSIILTDSKNGQAGFIAVREAMIDGKSKKLLLISFTGTQGARYISPDWMTNYKFIPSIQRSTINNKRIELAGVHDGWRGVQEKFWLTTPSLKIGGTTFGKILEEALTKDTYHIVVTGHSQGGATANITVKNLMDYGIPARRITSYTFASPKPVTSAPSGKLYPIINIINIGDTVPNLGASISSGTRYGIDNIGKQSYDGGEGMHNLNAYLSLIYADEYK